MRGASFFASRSSVRYLSLPVLRILQRPVVERLVPYPEAYVRVPVDVLSGSRRSVDALKTRAGFWAENALCVDCGRYYSYLILHCFGSLCHFPFLLMFPLLFSIFHFVF